MNSKAVELREQALAKLEEARALTDARGVVKAEDERAFQAAMAEFRELDKQLQAALGLPAPGWQSVDAALQWYTGRPAGMGGSGLPFPGAGGQPGIALPAAQRWHGVDVAAEFVDSLSHRAGFSGFAAELVTGGSVPVTVPVATQAVLEPRGAIFVADVIPEEDAPSGMWKYFKQTVRTNNAAPVVPSARKPTSVYTLAPVEGRTETIAHLSEPVNRNDLDDASMLRDFIASEMTFGTRQAQDQQILTGNATGAQFLGFLDPASGIQEEPIDLSGDLLVTTRKAITMLEVVDIPNPTAWVLNPTDWEAIELQASADYSANPNQPTAVDRMARRLWGVGVVVSNAIASGTGLLGDFSGYAKLYRTGGLRLDWSENIYRTAAEMGDGQPGSDFVRNMIAFRSEMRANLAILRPDAFVKVGLAEGS